MQYLLVMTGLNTTLYVKKKETNIGKKILQGLDTHYTLLYYSIVITRKS